MPIIYNVLLSHKNNEFFFVEYSLNGIIFSGYSILSHGSDNLNNSLWINIYSISNFEQYKASINILSFCIGLNVNPRLLDKSYS